MGLRAGRLRRGEASTRGVREYRLGHVCCDGKLGHGVDVVEVGHVAWRVEGEGVQSDALRHVWTLLLLQIMLQMVLMSLLR